MPPRSPLGRFLPTGRPPPEEPDRNNNNRGGFVQTPRVHSGLTYPRTRVSVGPAWPCSRLSPLIPSIQLSGRLVLSPKLPKRDSRGLRPSASPTCAPHPWPHHMRRLASFRRVGEVPLRTPAYMYLSGRWVHFHLSGVGAARRVHVGLRSRPRRAVAPMGRYH